MNVMFQNLFTIRLCDVLKLIIYECDVLKRTIRLCDVLKLIIYLCDVL